MPLSAKLWNGFQAVLGGLLFLFALGGAAIGLELFFYFIFKAFQ